MAKTATYATEVAWQGDHWGHLTLGNGPQMAFSAPPDAHGHAGVLTPEDAFVAAANTCVMMMFLWACERYKIDLVDYRCRVEGTKRIEIDLTEVFTHLRFWPEITVRAAAGGDVAGTERRVRKALASAQKYSLVANSVKSEIVIEPKIAVLPYNPSTSCAKESTPMLNIKVLGPGCTNCQNLMKNAQAAAEQLGIEATFEKLTDWSQFVPYGLRATPGLVVNEKLVSSGRVPTAAEITSMLATALSQN